LPLEEQIAVSTESQSNIPGVSEVVVGQFVVINNNMLVQEVTVMIAIKDIIDLTW